MSSSAKGILLMLLSMAVFTLLDTAGKYAQFTLDTFTSVFGRYAVALAITCVIILTSKGDAPLKTAHPVMQVLRGLLLVASTWCNFLAMKHLSLTTTSAIFFTIPLMVCALSALVLGEHVGPRRWMAVLVGFAGVLIIMRPGSMDFHWAMLLSLCASFAGALYNIATRRVGGHDRAETSLFYVGLFGTLAATLPLPWHWQMPQGFEWLLVLIMGMAGAGGHLMLIQAHRLAPASLLAPFIYTQIVWMTLASIIVFNQWPDATTLLGATIVVAAGIYVWHRERVRAVTSTSAI